MNTDLYCFVYWTRAETWISRTIQRVTGSPWSHVGIGFAPERNINQGMCYEALMGRGVTGPTSIERLENWSTKHVQRAWTYRWIDLPPGVARVKKAICDTWVGLGSYAPVQLAWLWLFKKYHIPVPKSPRKVICSEYVALVLQPERNYLTQEHPSMDSLTPGDIYDHENNRPAAGLR